MVGLDVEASQRLGRRVGEVVRHDDFGTGADSSCQDLPVVWVGARKEMRSIPRSQSEGNPARRR
jgi:hypothetical protein